MRSATHGPCGRALAGAVGALTLGTVPFLSVLAPAVAGAEGLPADTTDHPAVREAFAELTPEKVGSLPRMGIDVYVPMARDEGAILEASASYDTGPQMSFMLIVTFFEPDSPALARKKGEIADVEASFEHQGVPAYSRAYEGMGSGVEQLVEGPVAAWISVRSPRLSPEVRKRADPEARSDAPPPRAALESLDLERVRKLAASVGERYGGR